MIPRPRHQVLFNVFHIYITNLDLVRDLDKEVMNMYGAITPHGRIELSMWEYFSIIEGRLTLQQVLLRRELLRKRRN